MKRREKPVLYFLAFLLEVWIRNDAPTFNTAHLAGIAFFFRDTIRDQAAMGTGVWPNHWRKLWMSI
jgi:hypothetical protein